jgi:hypothetical protein
MPTLRLPYWSEDYKICYIVSLAIPPVQLTRHILVELRGGGKRSSPRNRPWMPIRFLDVEDPTLSRQSTHRCCLSCQPYPSTALYSLETLFLWFWYSFLLEAEWTQGLVLLEGPGKLKIVNSLIEFRTCDRKLLCFRKPSISSSK